jgi:pimeloyl-ACP methyl ester carboxylesterase
VLGRAHWIDADGVRVHAVEWEPVTPSTSLHPPILLVHGLGANTLSWEPIGQPLADRMGATVTAIDLVGFGRTRAPERTASIDTNRRLITSVLEALGPSVVIGNSMGGALGIAVTARRPDLVDALVLVNPALPQQRPRVSDWPKVARFLPVFTPIGHRWIGARARLLGPERLVASSLELSLADPSAMDAGLRTRLVALATERYDYPEAPMAYADAARTLFLYLARGFNVDLVRAAESRPTLLLHGELDRLVALAAAHQAARRCATLDLEVLTDIGHAPQLEAPDRVVAAITGWLDGAASDRRRTPNDRMQACQASSTIPSGSSSTS